MCLSICLCLSVLTNLTNTCDINSCLHLFDIYIILIYIYFSFRRSICRRTIARVNREANVKYEMIKYVQISTKTSKEFDCFPPFRTQHLQRVNVCVCVRYTVSLAHSSNDINHGRNRGIQTLAMASISTILNSARDGQMGT